MKRRRLTLNFKSEVIFNDGSGKFVILSAADQVLSTIVQMGHQSDATVTDVAISWCLCVCFFGKRQKKIGRSYVWEQSLLQRIRWSERKMVIVIILVRDICMILHPNGIGRRQHKFEATATGHLHLLFVLEYLPFHVWLGGERRTSTRRFGPVD